MHRNIFTGFMLENQYILGMLGSPNLYENLGPPKGEGGGRGHFRFNVFLASQDAVEMIWVNININRSDLRFQILPDVSKNVL